MKTSAKRRGRINWVAVSVVFQVWKYIFPTLDDARAAVKWVAAVAVSVITILTAPVSLPLSEPPYKIANESQLNVTLPSVSQDATAKSTAAFDMIVTCGPLGVTISCRPY